MAALAACSGGRLVPLGAGALLDGCAGACVAGRALHDLKALAPLLDQLERRGLVLFVHPGPASEPPAGRGWWAPVVGYTAELQAAYFAWLAWGAERWPRLGVVFAILAGGAPFQLERLASRRGGREATVRSSVYLDTASYGPIALRLCLEALGPSQLVYGSDAPVIDTRPTLDAVRRLGPALERALRRDNPARLLAGAAPR